VSRLAHSHVPNDNARATVNEIREDGKTNIWSRFYVKQVIELGKYPYIHNTGSLKKFLENIPKIGTPPKITQPELPKLGFKSTADRPIVPILKFIGFLDEANVPSQSYKDFKLADKAGAVMASALQKAYSDLFEIYPDACERDDKSLKDFFTPTTDAGPQVVAQTAATFKVLCGFANFKAVIKEEKGKGEEEHKGKAGGEEGRGAQTGAGVTINLNIQLALPATEDAKVYENIFKALRDNLLARD